ncbi:MAG TPA: histidine kinase [Marmoricola sp.]|nr:histidine kinase [Marmoricola sp.]
MANLRNLTSRAIPRQRATDNFVALVADLQSLGPGDTLRNALRRMLGDPNLDIAYLRVGSRGWIDDAGRTMTAPVETEGRAVTPIDRGGKPFAALIHDPALLGSPERLRAAVDAASLAFDNEHMKADLRAQIDDLRASRARIVEAVDVERRRTERNLHDGAQQRLVGLSLLLRRALRQAGSDPALAASLTDALAELEEGISELRELARGIHPGVVAASGLAGALETLAERPGVPVELTVDLPAGLPEVVELVAYYVVAESLTNAKKYSGASLVSVDARVEGDALLLSVTDDGSGGAAPEAGSGLEGLVDRVAAIGGRLVISSPERSGTVVEAELPLTVLVAPERDPTSLAALRWTGWEEFELPTEVNDQLSYEDQRSWIRGVFACAGGVSHVTPAEREWVLGMEASAGAAGWVLESMRAHDVNESVADILALPGMEHTVRGLIYDAIRMCASDGDLTQDELARITRSTEELGIPAATLTELLAITREERALRRRRYEAIPAPELLI